MNLVDALARKIAALDEGGCTPGLKAVLRHIETAAGHLSRGQASGDETAYTDAIYRCNQAFEGGVKEAYRVLASMDPEKTTPYEIETYLEKQKVFKSRVLSQFSTYRKEWRNPSTHDHKLDFDESEAFLAIVSVAALACVLLDQISERLAFDRAKATADAQVEAVSVQFARSNSANLQDRVERLLLWFCSLPIGPAHKNGMPNEAQSIGAIHGFLASVAPELKVVPEATVGNGMLRVDLLISSADEQVIVEVKSSRYRGDSKELASQVDRYMDASDIKAGIGIVVPGVPQQMEVITHVCGMAGESVTVIRPLPLSLNS